MTSPGGARTRGSGPRAEFAVSLRSVRIAAGIALVAASAALVLSLPGRPAAGRPESPVESEAILPGLFQNPRSAAVGPEGTLYVVDRTARVFAIGRDGHADRVIEMPEKKNGNPQGICVSQSGILYVADTHYHRILAFSPAGALLGGFGSFGTGPGQFLYVTSVLAPGNGMIYAAEYGGNDRIQAFDEDGRFLLAFGARGDGKGMFDRPSGMAMDRQGRLYVADACNHRIQVFDGRGALKGSFGTRGNGPGQLNYPWDVEITPGGSVAVVEYGNHRVSFFGTDGAFRGSACGPGHDGGMLYCPWGLASGPGGELYVADTSNNRILLLKPGLLGFAQEGASGAESVSCPAEGEQAAGMRGAFLR